MLEITCIAGLLIFNTTAYNPDRIDRIESYEDKVYVFTPSSKAYYKVGSVKESLEAWETSLKLWNECSKNKE